MINMTDSFMIIFIHHQVVEKKIKTNNNLTKLNYYGKLPISCSLLEYRVFYRTSMNCTILMKVSALSVLLTESHNNAHSPVAGCDRLQLLIT